MNTWDKLSMAEKAEIMRLAVAGGVYDLDAIRGGYNEFARGGKIHIKPENRGKFTRLKERTGHSASWFKAHGTPAQKKMAIFELNARHWKHGMGGNLFDGESQNTQQMNNIMSYNPEGNYWTGPQTLLDPVTVTGNAPKKQKGLYPVRHKFKGFDNWTSPKGAGNMTVMPGDPEMVFFAPIAAGAGIAASPVISSAVGSAVSGINTAGDALAATAAGQRLTSGLNFVANAVGSSKAWPWIDAGLTSAFGAHGINHIVNGGVNGWGDAAMTALEVTPLGRLAKPAFEMGYSAVKPIFDKAITSLQNNYPALFDPYTSWDATLGYHGDNIFSRVLGTVGRRHGFTPKAEVPEFHRRLTINRPSQLKLDEEGNMIISSGRTGEGHDGIVNFATSEPARGHSSHKSLSGIDDYIIDSKAIGNQDFKSIQPSDTFFETGQLAIDPKSMTLVSGNTEMLDYARSLGIRTLSSPRLRQLTASRMTKEDVINSRSEGIAKFLQNVGEIKYGKGQQNAGQIGEEMQRLTSMRGTPTMQDYSYFEGLTGLNSGVRPAEMWNGTKEQGLELFGNWGKPRRTPTFNHVAYAPASNIESIYREAKMGTRPWEDYYAALENMPSARQQLGLNSAMDTYLGEPVIPEGYLTVKPQVRTRVGDVEIDDPNLLYHLDRGNGVGAFSNQGAYVENGMLLPGIAKEGEVPYSWWNLGRPYSTSVNGHPMTRLMTATEDTPGMLHVRSQNYPIGQWNGKRGFVTNAEYVNPEGVNVSESTYTLDPNYGWRRLFAEDASTAKWADAVKTPQITAENAASTTPSQWTTAQDAAIARGDMAEAQRLRDLHFKINAPNTVASVNGQPLQLYHGTDATFNAFDISKYGSTDGGTFGRGVYTTPIKEYAALYGKNNMPLYMKLDNPKDYRNSSIGDLIAEKLAFGDDFATGNGIDGVVGRPSWKGFKGLEEYVSHNPKNIKSSLPVTYDNNGVRIPLGERDNFKLNDIRYSWLTPFIGLGTLGTVYGTSNKKQE